MKTCKTCGDDKARSEYYHDRTMADGLRSSCKLCVRAKRRAYCAANPEKVRECNAAYRRTDKAQELRRATNRERAKTERFRLYQKQWATTEQGKRSGRGRVNRYAHTPKGRAANSRRRAARRAKEAQIINTLTAAEWSAILSDHGDRCAYCLTPFSASCPATMDHVIPVSKGGHHTKENVVPACKPCNSKKKDRLAHPSSLSRVVSPTT